MPTNPINHLPRTFTGASVSVVRTTWQDVNGDWANTSNWSLAATPARMNRVHVGNGTEDITTNLNQSSIFLDELRFGPDWTGKIDGTLQIGANAVHINRRWGAITLSGTYRRVYVYESQPGDDAITLGGTIHELWVAGSVGELVISNSAALGAVHVSPRAGRSVRLTIGSSVAAPTGGSMTLRAQGRAYIETASSFSSVDLDGAVRLVVTGSATVTAAKVSGAAVIDYQSSGTTGAGNEAWDGGRVFMRNNVNSAVSINGWTTYPGSELDLRNGLGAATSSGVTYRGGLVRLDEEETLTVTP